MKKYEFDTSRQLRKSIIIWEHNGEEFTPIMYLTKPKFVKQEDFDKLVDRMQIIIHDESTLMAKIWKTS